MYAWVYIFQCNPNIVVSFILNNKKTLCFGNDTNIQPNQILLSPNDIQFRTFILFFFKYIYMLLVSRVASIGSNMNRSRWVQVHLLVLMGWVNKHTKCINQNANAVIWQCCNAHSNELMLETYTHAHTLTCECITRAQLDKLSSCYYNGRKTNSLKYK